MVDVLITREIVHILSSAFVLIFAGFDTFYVQEMMEMVCNTFVILTLSCYLFLSNKMFDLKRKSMLRRGFGHGRYCF